jgi:hypothetical protein
MRRCSARCPKNARVKNSRDVCVEPGCMFCHRQQARRGALPCHLPLRTMSLDLLTIHSESCKHRTFRELGLAVRMRAEQSRTLEGWCPCSRRGRDVEIHLEMCTTPSWQKKTLSTHCISRSVPSPSSRSFLSSKSVFTIGMITGFYS